MFRMCRYQFTLNLLVGIPERGRAAMSCVLLSQLLPSTLEGLATAVLDGRCLHRFTSMAVPLYPEHNAVFLTIWLQRLIYL